LDAGAGVGCAFDEGEFLLDFGGFEPFGNGSDGSIEHVGDVGEGEAGGEDGGEESGGVGGGGERAVGNPRLHFGLVWLGSTDQRTGQWHGGGRTPSDLEDSATSPGGPGEGKIGTPSALRGLGHLARWKRGRGSARGCGGGAGWGGGVVVGGEAGVPGEFGADGGLCFCHDSMMGRGLRNARGFVGWGANVRTRGGIESEFVVVARGGKHGARAVFQTAGKFLERGPGVAACGLYPRLHTIRPLAWGSTDQRTGQ
jgi:hypothetical protein